MLESRAAKEKVVESRNLGLGLNGDPNSLFHFINHPSINQNQFQSFSFDHHFKRGCDCKRVNQLWHDNTHKVVRLMLATLQNHEIEEVMKKPV